jgi:hypothetical protein
MTGWRVDRRGGAVVAWRKEMSGDGRRESRRAAASAPFIASGGYDARARTAMRLGVRTMGRVASIGRRVRHRGCGRGVRVAAAMSRSQVALGLGRQGRAWRACRASALSWAGEKGMGDKLGQAGGRAGPARAAWRRVGWAVRREGGLMG